jgi:hypothetical protein
MPERSPLWPHFQVSVNCYTGLASIYFSEQSGRPDRVWILSFRPVASPNFRLHPKILIELQIFKEGYVVFAAFAPSVTAIID